MFAPGGEVMIQYPEFIQTAYSCPTMSDHPRMQIKPFLLMSAYPFCEVHPDAQQNKSESLSIRGLGLKSV